MNPKRSIPMAMAVLLAAAAIPWAQAPADIDAALKGAYDDAGNSVRAQKAIQMISQKLGGNPYEVKGR